ncbi:MAG: hypothetical protein AAB198_06450 [Actinomycetota bacterium]
MKRPAGLLSATLIVLSLAACSSGDPLGVYISDVAAVTEQMTRDSFAALPPGAAPTRDQVAAVVAARRTAFDAISSLAPPEEMAPEHLALTTAIQRFVIASETFVIETAELDAIAFSAALEASTDIDVLADVVGAACTAWERRAGELDHATELGC